MHYASMLTSQSKTRLRLSWQWLLLACIIFMHSNYQSMAADPDYPDYPDCLSSATCVNDGSCGCVFATTPRPPCFAWDICGVSIPAPDCFQYMPACYDRDSPPVPPPTAEFVRRCRCPPDGACGNISLAWEMDSSNLPAGSAAANNFTSIRAAIKDVKNKITLVPDEPLEPIPVYYYRCTGEPLTTTATTTTPKPQLPGMTLLADVDYYYECGFADGAICGYWNVSDGAAPDIVPAEYILKGFEACTCTQGPGYQCRNSYVSGENGLIKFQCRRYSQPPPPTTTTGTTATTASTLPTAAVTSASTDPGLNQLSTTPLEETTVQPEPDQTKAPPEPDTLPEETTTQPVPEDQTDAPLDTTPLEEATTQPEPVQTTAPPDTQPEDTTTAANPAATTPFDAAKPCGTSGAMCGIANIWSKSVPKAVVQTYGFIPPVYGRPFCECPSGERCSWFSRSEFYCNSTISSTRPLPNCDWDGGCGTAFEDVTSVYQDRIAGVTKFQPDTPGSNATCQCMETQTCVFSSKVPATWILIFDCVLN